MPIIVSCWSCGSQLRAPDSWAGRRVKCPRCSQEFTVPVGPDLPTALPADEPLPSEAVQTAPPRIALEPEPPDSFPPVPSGAGMQYLRAYQYIFENPNWTTNLLLGSVASIIPVIGGLLLNGYCFDCTEALHKAGGRRYPDFDFSRFVDYLVRGLWPFVMALCIMFPLGIVLMMIVILSVRAGIVLIAPFYLVMIALQIFVLTPALVYAGLRQELDFGGTIQFVRDLLRRAWVELLLAELFLMVTGTLVVMAGLMLCCIGVLPAGVILWLARAHLYYQLYELYLQRGGSPIPLKSPAR